MPLCKRPARSVLTAGGPFSVSIDAKKPCIHCMHGFSGAPAGTRILDPLIKSQMLYQLSYRHILYCVSHSPNIIAGECGVVNTVLQKFCPEIRVVCRQALAKYGPARYNTILE